ncbi:MAG: mechanosensitive ion channel family protein [Bdellovibrionia bacterium]
MTSKTQAQPWVQLERIDGFIHIEPAIITLSLVLAAWLISKIFLKTLSEDRSRTLATQFSNLGVHLIFGTGLFVAYLGLHQLPDTAFVERIMTYVGLITIFSGSAIFIKTWRILVFEYLYLSHMRVAFPVLLVNLFTLLLSIVLAGWIGAEIFNLQLTPLIATSAIFSLVLGLALQDTLGNLFAGVALQFDKPYEIGDWVEIQTGTQKWTGQVYEISWRATILVGMGEEIITVPNRVMGQAQITNFTTKYRPILRALIFRFPFDVNLDRVKKILAQAASAVPEVRRSPTPFVLISDTSESWISCKLIYYIDHFGTHTRVADAVYSQSLSSLEAAGISLAKHQLKIETLSENVLSS